MTAGKTDETEKKLENVPPKYLVHRLIVYCLLVSTSLSSLQRSPFKAWSRSVYSHTRYAYCREFLPCLFVPFQSIQLHFKKNFRFFSCVICG